MPQTQSVPAVTPASHVRTVLSFILRKAAIACGYAATLLAMLRRPALRASSPAPAETPESPTRRKSMWQRTRKALRRKAA